MYKKVKLYSSLVLVGLALSSTVATTTVSATTSNDNSTNTTKVSSKNDDSKATQKIVDSSSSSNDNTDSKTSDNQDGETSVSTNKEMGPGYYDSNFNINSWVMPSMADSDFLSQIKAGAIEGWTKYKILPSLTAAQAVLESGNGTSALSQPPFNNLFGIKGTPGQPWRTAEQDANGNVYYITATFRTYPSFKESIEDHNALLGTTSRYSNLVGVKDYQTATARVKADGYATATNYASALNRIIVSDGLTSWDQEAFNQTSYPHPAVDT
ncbi:hypothetical protein FHL06_12175, partial [Lactobacillus halodurans]